MNKTTKHFKAHNHPLTYMRKFGIVIMLIYRMWWTVRKTAGHWFEKKGSSSYGIL
jgi:hypothetical protein